MTTKNPSTNVDSLKRICFDYITRPCSSENLTFCSECSLFCLPFKIYDRVETNTHYYCTFESFLCEKYCHNLDHERVPNCNNYKINEDCSGLDGYWRHCILYNCDACAFRDNLSEICGELTKGKDNTCVIYYTLNNFFTLLCCYWGFGQLDIEKYDQYYDHFYFNLPDFAICRCTWDIY